MPDKAYIYTRSSKHEDTETAQDSQHRSCKAAIPDGYEFAGSFNDVITGASPLSGRPAWSSIMELATPGDVIIVSKLDRFSRSVQHGIETLKELADAGINVISVHDHIDTADQSPMGHAMRTLLLTFAQLQRDLIAAASKEGQEAARERGVRIGRPPAVSPTDCEMIRAWHRLKTPIARIAREKSISRDVVRKIVTGHGAYGEAPYNRGLDLSSVSADDLA
jgi:DNA invertase Pin-like site-specific DNA recombinase